MKITFNTENKNYIKIDDIPFGECFTIGGTVYLMLDDRSFWDFTHGVMRYHESSRTDACARIVNAELVVAP